MTYEKICTVIVSFALSYNNSANTRKNPSFFDKLMLTFNDNIVVNTKKKTTETGGCTKCYIFG